jgi:hypothetical protein
MALEESGSIPNERRREADGGEENISCDGKPEKRG